MMFKETEQDGKWVNGSGCPRMAPPGRLLGMQAFRSTRPESCSVGPGICILEGFLGNSVAHWSLRTTRLTLSVGCEPQAGMQVLGVGRVGIGHRLGGWSERML